eukprot:s790_g3.t1
MEAGVCAGGVCTPCLLRSSHGTKKPCALVLHTPARSFSFLFANVSQRDVFGQFLVYLISKHDRGMTSVDTMSAATTARDADLDEPPTQANASPPKEGRGRVTYPNHSWYEGDFSEYQRHGRGTLHLPDWGVVCRVFTNQHLKGSLEQAPSSFWEDGTKHECQWHKDERHGPGREYWADGTVFRGHYVHGLRHGHGVMTWPEGSRYTGLFERGRANGDGELVRTDGSDCMSGDGCMQWVDGVEYKGQFAANRRHGFGKMVWTSGKWKSYEGSWKAGGQHGRGILTDQDDAVYVGNFLDGKINRWEGSPPDSGLSAQRSQHLKLPQLPLILWRCQAFEKLAALAALLYSIALLRNLRAQKRATERSIYIAGAGTSARTFACVGAWPRLAKTVVEVPAAFHGSCLHAEAGSGKWSSQH